MENNFYKLYKETKSMECLTCGKKLSGSNSHNMKRHYKLMHRMDIPLVRRKRKFNDKGELVYEKTQQELNINEIDQQIKIENTEPNIKHVMPTENTTELRTTDQMPTEKVATIFDKRILELEGCKKFVKHKELNKTECLVCGRHLSGISSSNIRRHFHLVHNIEISTKANSKYSTSTTSSHITTVTNEEDNSTESLESYSAKRLKLNHSTASNNAFATIDCNRFLKCCIGLVAVKGISASIFDDDEFFKILIAPQEQKFGTNLNSDDISTLLQSASLTARDVIISKMKNKIISLKMDLATEANTKLLNISVQYIDHFKICHNTLDIIQFDKEETDFKAMVLRCLESYEINKDQVYCYMTEITSKEQNKEIVGESTTIMNDAKQLLTPLTTELHEVKSANSIIQLTVSDVLTKIETNLNQYRILERKLQTMFDCYQDGFILDNATNWLSTYKMLESLRDNTTYLEEECVTKTDSLENNLDLNFVTDLITSLTPLVNLNKQLNNEQYIFGDFYRDWLNCEIELEELFSSSLLSRLILKSMQKHKQELLKDEKFLAALYLDPRFNFCNSVMLSEEQKRKAEGHLVKQYKLIQTTFKNHTPPLLTTTTNIDENSSLLVPTIKSEDEPSTSKKAYDKLAQRIMNLSANLNDTDEPQRKFKQKLMFLLSTKMMAPLDTNVLDYWKNTNFDADITAILEAALNVPVTQVTIGRAANTLWYSNEDIIDRDLFLTKYNFKEINENYVEL